MTYTYPGKLITIEGIDGAGKSSLVESLKSYLEDCGYEVLTTREPGGSQLGKAIRSLIQERTCPISDRAEFLLFAADRAQHIQEVIIPALTRGAIVISDRLADSSLAYQGYGRGLDQAFINHVNQWALSGITPDLTIYLKIDYATARQRMRIRAEKATAIEQEKEVFFNRVIAGFNAIFSERSAAFIVDARVSQDEITHKVIEHMNHFLFHREL